MRKLALFALTASALTLPAVALAQQAGHAGPRGPSGHSFSRGGSHVNVRSHSNANSHAVARSHSNAVARSHSNAVSHSRSNVGHSRSNTVVRHGGANTVVRHGGSNVHVRHGGGRFRHPGPNFRHGRLERGFAIHPYWFAPQFHVQNWQLYGFSEPPRDHRWVRYYDDAYLIDREGRVQDTRYGLDWDEYGERWDSDAGIPSYYGRGDYYPDGEDYAWVESQEGRGYAEGWDYRDYGAERDDYAQGHYRGSYEDDRGGYEERARYERRDGYEGYREQGHGESGGYAYRHTYPAPPPACHPAPPQPCGGYGGGYGHGGGYGYGYYGYGVAYPIIIETTVVGGGTSYIEEVTEEVVEVQQTRRRAYRPPVRQRPRPRPPAGERG